MAKPNIVLYPCPGMGHLISMVELAKFILQHHPSSAVTILTAPPPLEAAAAYIRHVSAAVPSITFHYLPQIPLDINAFPSREAAALEGFRRRNPDVRRALEPIAAVSAVSAFVIDFFGTPSLPIAAEFNIPSFYFITSGAAFLALMLYFPTLDKVATRSFKDMGNTLLHVPGIPPFPASDVIRTMLDRTAQDYYDFMNISINLRNSGGGIIVNTFEEFETKTLESIREGSCNPEGPTPRVFSVGPLLAKSGAGGGTVLKWLDRQPSKTVVYLCFGSLGLFSVVQLKEIAKGLEGSGHRFLWVVRLAPAESDLEAVLPARFLDRTKDRGLVVTPWAPQVEVLNHGAVGGFVTHCGWNSILEAVWAGVPMVGWPLYAEQHLNRDVMVDGMGVGLRMGAAEDGFVAAEEVAARVTELMDGGSEVRRVVEEKRLEARAAMAEGGSSVGALGKLVELWKCG